MKAIVVLSFDVPDDQPDQLGEILKEIDPPHLRSFAGTARIAIAESAEHVIEYLDGPPEDETPAEDHHAITANDDLHMVGSDTLMVSEVELSLGKTGKFGSEEQQLVFFMTMDGRYNNTQDRKKVHMILDHRLAFDVAGDVIDKIGNLVESGEATYKEDES